MWCSEIFCFAESCPFEMIKRIVIDKFTSSSCILNWIVVSVIVDFDHNLHFLVFRVSIIIIWCLISSILCVSALDGRVGRTFCHNMTENGWKPNLFEKMNQGSGNANLRQFAMTKASLELCKKSVDVCLRLGQKFGSGLRLNKFLFETKGEAAKWGWDLHLHTRKVISARLFDCYWPTSSRMKYLEDTFVWHLICGPYYYNILFNYSVQHLASDTPRSSDIFRSTGASELRTVTALGYSPSRVTRISLVWELAMFSLFSSWVTNFLRETCEQAAEINAIYLTSTSAFPFYLRSCLQFWHFALLT